jgi:hypothetical protein
MNRQHLNVSDLNSAQLRNIVSEIQRILWFDFDRKESDLDCLWHDRKLHYWSNPCCLSQRR